ncbi:hypothetical protein TorRG33x02_274720 [Trema orientale]|uniref:Uncharacterized protein n=1 Tax=Trema orientale TaxID=63057 RepID=A0A2P5CS95_TREOI|nr:hypothetical protein TorRG33x02_274720 [Trema orientale]
MATPHPIRLFTIELSNGPTTSVTAAAASPKSRMTVGATESPTANPIIATVTTSSAPTAPHIPCAPSTAAVDSHNKLNITIRALSAVDPNTLQGLCSLSSFPSTSILGALFSQQMPLVNKGKAKAFKENGPMPGPFKQQLMDVRITTRQVFKCSKKDGVATTTKAKVTLQPR